MATIKTKAALYADSAALPNPITRVALIAHMDNIVASYENIIQEYTTVQRDALTPFEGQKIYNTTSNRLEYYSASKWLPCSQKETITVDCSANPNYPEALVGDQYIVTVAGYIGGGSGKAVNAGDMVYCVVANAGGAEGSVGTSWKVCYSSGSGAQLKKATVTLTTAQILALNGTPIQIIAAVSGKAIQVVSGFIKASFNTTPYATNVSLKVTNLSASLAQMETEIDFVADIFQSLVPVNQVAHTAQQLVVNDLVEVFVETGNPTAGDSDITITVFYLEV